MSVSYDSAAPATRPRTRSTSAPPPSLMNRLEKLPLTERMTKDDFSYVSFLSIYLSCPALFVL